MKQNILTLAVSNLVIGLIEFVFNMYLSRILGAEGLGLLSLVSPVNCLFLSFMTEGLVVTVSKISAKHFYDRDYAAMNAAIRVTTVFSFLWSLLLTGLVFLTARPLAVWFLGDAELVYPILATCPLMLLMSVSNIIKGHFLGLAMIRIPAVINISEKLLRFPILYLLIRFLLNRFSFPAVTLVYLCYAIGEMQSVLFLLIYYKKTKPQVPPVQISFREICRILKPLVQGAAPICMTQCLLESVNAFSSVIVKSRLCSIGYSASQALTLMGKYKGMVFPMMNYPMILVGSICSIVVPRISTMFLSGKKVPAKRLIGKVLRVSLCIGILTGLLFFVLADDMGLFFYKREDLGLMIRLAGLCAPLLYVTAASTSLLISIGREAQSFRNSLLQQLLLLIFLLVFIGIPQLNIYGYILAIALSNSVLLVQNLYALTREMRKIS
ncbi:MAG: oligosaccharide flippase family protein, partial [Emergencia sp.]